MAKKTKKTRKNNYKAKLEIFFEKPLKLIKHPRKSFWLKSPIFAFLNHWSRNEKFESFSAAPQISLKDNPVADRKGFAAFRVFVRSMPVVSDRVTTSDLVAPFPIEKVPQRSILCWGFFRSDQGAKQPNKFCFRKLSSYFSPLSQIRLKPMLHIKQVWSQVVSLRPVFWSVVLLSQQHWELLACIKYCIRY